MTFAGEYADKTRGAATWATPEPRPRALTLQGTPCSDDPSETAVADARPRILDRRDDTADPSVRVIACVDVKSNALANGHNVTSDVLRDLAVRRMERCIRPADRVCMLGASRLAVCFGHGSHRIAPSELGRRMARAMGDHLTVGTTTLDLRVTIGVSAGTTAVEPGDLIDAAIASTRSPQSRVSIARSRLETASSTVTVIEVPERHELLHVAPGGFGQSVRRSRGTGATGATAPATTHRLLRRTSYRRLDPVDRDTGTPGTRAVRHQAPDPDRFPPHSRVAGLSILVVDPAVASSDTPRSAVQGVAAAARRLGVCPILSAADRPDTVVDDLSVSEADAVVLILHPDTARPLSDADGGTPWEHPARLARALVDAGASVIALSVGSSAAGVAACVEQGAAGLLHIDALADELVTVAKVSAGKVNGAARVNGNGSQRGRRQLPAPFDALVHLTSTERKVLFHMMEGRAAGEIASELVVSLTTVRSHIRSILRKLNVNSQLAAVAIANGAYPRATALG
ncbi:MAG TPA: LuxR C-terminal-related transcriptional regulator [Acidimicrobiales bacterium]|nr:LuxR C-terminal-related transcriptional regulator [Acidimicrobiales bacterium]